MSQTCLAGFAVLFLLAAPASRTGDTQLEGGVDLFRSGYREWDIEQLTKAARVFEEAVQEDPEDRVAHYWLGVTRFHILLHRNGGGRLPLDDREFSKLAERARQPLREALRIKNNDAEAHALLGTLGGMEISRARHKALWLGPGVSRHLRAAAKYGESNPRVLYLRGAALVKGPAALGGPDRGLAHLQHAEQLYESEAAAAESPSPSTPLWGREHCLVLIGQVYADRGDAARAAEYYRKALTLNPEHGLAQRFLDALKEDGAKNE